MVIIMKLNQSNINRVPCIFCKRVTLDEEIDKLIGNNIAVNKR